MSKDTLVKIIGALFLILSTFVGYIWADLTKDIESNASKYENILVKVGEIDDKIQKIDVRDAKKQVIDSIIINDLNIIKEKLGAK